MKNKEKYAEEIMEIACSGDKLAMKKDDECLTKCSRMRCSDCRFSGKGECSEAIHEWAESECIEKPVISKRDRALLEYLREGTDYIARDMNGGLYAYISKPYRAIDCWDSREGELAKNLGGFKLDFPMVKWSDSKPWLTEDLKKLEVVDSYE